MDDDELRKLRDVDFPDMGEITEETRRKAIETSQSGRYSSLPVRLATGRFYTDKGYEKRRKRVLEMRIP